MPCILLFPLLDLVQCIYIEGRWIPSQSSIDALHITTPTARYSTMHIYRRQTDPPSQLSTDTLHTTTLTGRSRPPSQLSIDAF